MASPTAGINGPYAMFAPLHRWILNHDDSKIFVVAYIGLAVVLAIFLGLFWLAVVVGLHLLMETVKQYHYDSRPLPVLTRSLWELKLDIGLVVFGLVVGLYIDVVFGLVGLGHLGRAGAQTAARVGMWPRVLRGALLTVDDVALVAKGVALRGNKKVEESQAVAEGAAMSLTGTDGASGGIALGSDATVTTSDGDIPEERFAEPCCGHALWGGWIAPRWGLGDKIALGFTGLNVVLILIASLLTHHSFVGVWVEILAELHPFPD